MTGRRRPWPPIGLNERRRLIAESEAREFVGTLYSVLVAHGELELRALKRSADWRGVVESLSIAFRRYADGEARALLQRRTCL